MKRKLLKALSILFITLTVLLFPVTAFAQENAEFEIDEENFVYVLDDEGGRFYGDGEFTSGENVYTVTEGRITAINGENTGFVTIEEKQYLISDGILFTGLYDKKYYENGLNDTKLTGYKTVNGKNYYFKKGALATTVITATSGENKGKLIYIKNGLFNKASGKTNVGKSTYFFSKGVAQGGLKTIDGKKYYFNKKTFKCIKNYELKLSGKWYIANKDGVLKLKPKAYVRASELIAKLTKANDAKKAKLYKCYKWTAATCKYKFKDGYNDPVGKKWVNNYAYNMMNTQRGRCYSFSAAFAVMARELGYTNVRVVVGECNGFTGKYLVHCWVEIDINGETRVFDPEWQYRHPGKNYTSAYNKTYDKVPHKYKIDYTIDVNK
ncbi:MAG: transglutaminase domain-containing protein [Ruminococcaceae bacterium]|nr:transglutaminase domain-containing protein [Oscillospiraceae bacterium]